MGPFGTTFVAPTPFVLSEELQRSIAALAERQTFLAKNTIFRKGEAPIGVFLILLGDVEITAGEDETLFRRVAKPGSILGLPGTMSDQPYSLTATSIDKVEVGFVSRDKFLGFLRERPQECMEVLRVLADEVGIMRRVAAEAVPAS